MFSLRQRGLVAETEWNQVQSSNATELQIQYPATNQRFERALFASDMATVISLLSPANVFPYNDMIHGKEKSCLIPSKRLRTQIDRHVASMPQNYSCLHARVEPDWFTHCCDGSRERSFSRLDLFFRDWRMRQYPHQPDLWRCGVWREQDTTCYKTPTQIVDTILRKGAVPGSTLWTASGASDRALLPLSKQFKVRRPAKTSGNFMDYDVALVEREVCSRASHAWLSGKSSFSQYIQGETAVKFYSDKRKKGQKKRKKDNDNPAFANDSVSTKKELQGDFWDAVSTS